METNTNKLFYQSQLSDNANIIYNELYRNKEKLKTGTYEISLPNEISNLLYSSNGEEELNNAFQDSWDAFIYDNPDMFFIDTGKISLTTKTKTYGFKKSYEVTIGCGDNLNYFKDEFKNAAEVQLALNKIDAVKNEILRNCTGTDSQKIRTVHDWLINNLEYETGELDENVYNIYGAFVNKKVVCEGYAKAFKTLLDDLQIECILVKGNGTNSNGQVEKHMWNYVLIDGIWYGMDVTWDDPIIEGTGYVNPNTYYKYYLKGKQSFINSHQEEGRISYQGKIFKYPEISDYDY